MVDWSSGVGGGGLDDDGLDVADDEVTEVVLLFLLLSSSYILYRERTETVAGVGNDSVFSLVDRENTLL